MNTKMKLTEIGGYMTSETLFPKKKSHFDQAVQIQVKLVSLGQNHTKEIENVTLTLGSMEEGWQIFESLTNLVWKEVGSSSKASTPFG